MFTPSVVDGTKRVLHVVFELAIVSFTRGLASDAEVFEVGVGFALGHRTPRTFAEEKLHVVIHGAGAADFGRCIGESSEAFSVMLDDAVASLRQFYEGMTVRRQHVFDPGQRGDLAKRTEVVI